MNIITIFDDFQTSISPSSLSNNSIQAVLDLHLRHFGPSTKSTAVGVGVHLKAAWFDVVLHRQHLQASYAEFVAFALHQKLLTAAGPFIALRYFLQRNYMQFLHFYTIQTFVLD